MVVMGIMMGIAAVGMVTYRTSAEHRGARDQVVSMLRSAGERALSEQRTYCVQVSSGGWSLYRVACSGPGSVPVDSARTLDSSKETLAGSFTHPTGHASACGTSACVYFYPRGNSSDGSLTVSRSDSGRADYIIDVEGLTSRVSTSG
jgi:Tfp pilus assembly protein FimT